MKPSAEASLILALLAFLFFLSMRSRLSQREEIVRATPLGKRPQRRPRPCTAEPEAPQTPLGPVRVACVGDSLTRGDRDANGSKPLRKWALVGNYPIRLQERLGRRGVAGPQVRHGRVELCRRLSGDVRALAKPLRAF